MVSSKCGMIRRAVVAATLAMLSLLTGSCSNPGGAAETSSPSATKSNVGVPPSVELKVPLDLIHKSAADAQAQLSAAGIPFTTTLKEVEDPEVGTVLEVDPPGGTVLAQGSSVRLLIGKSRESVELRVPSDLIDKPADDVQAQLSAAGIPFTTTFKEVEDSEVGIVLEVDPPGGTVLAQGSSVRLLIGKPKAIPTVSVRPGDLGITEIAFSRIAGSVNCNITVTVFNHLRSQVSGINVTGELKMRDQSNTRITLDFSRSMGLQTIEAEDYHSFRGYVTFLQGVTASYQIQVVQGPTVIDQVSEQVATCA
jgi:PASTA domain